MLVLRYILLKLKGDTTIANDNRQKDKDKTIMNERIRSKEVRLIDENGENRGIVETVKALKMAYDADLTPLLNKCNNEDLEPLVQYIVEKGSVSETLSTDDLYEQYYPDHTKYINVIVEEIQDFGGDSFVNIFRGGGPQYREILMDVADKFDVEYDDDDSTEQIEQFLVITVFMMMYNELDEKDKQTIQADTNIDIEQINNINTVESLKKYPVGWIISAVLGALFVSGPAYRVTIPCVLHIAMLREKYS